MNDHRIQIVGWVLFILSAIGFIVSSWRSGDGAALTGALLFLLACFVFLAPLIRGQESEP